MIATERKDERSGAWYLYNKDVRESMASMVNSSDCYLSKVKENMFI